jgi:localization factor PodJL
VDRETRDAAQEAARRAGMSLGEWLDQVIADHAAEQGVEVSDFDGDARLDAVADRLSELSRPDSARADARRSRARAPRDDFDDEAPLRRPRALAESRESAQRAEELLEAAIEKFEARAAQGEERTARALDSVAQWIERSQSGSRNERQAIDALVDRLDGIEEKIVTAQKRAEALAQKAEARRA